jgi:endonuclease-8
MPEGDSLHRAARRLRALVGERVEVDAPHPRGRATGVAARLHGRRLLAVEAAGKNLLLRFEGGLVLRSHLRMTGRWQLVSRGAKRQGRPWLVLRGAEREAVLWNGPVLELHERALDRVGPDILADSPDLERMVRRLRRTDQQRAVGEALLDQRLVAGIGNVWKAESLWHARVSPWRRLGGVSDDELRATLGEAARLMRISLETGRGPRSIYRRRRCPRCGSRIESRGQGDDNRTAYWCPRCQPGAEPRS